MSDSDRIDWTVAIVKGTIGAVPVVGPIVAEVVGNLRPRQRIDRIATFLRELEIRLQLTQEEFRKRLDEPQAIDLLEDGLHQAARAVSDERKQQIASIVADGLSTEGLNYLESKHLLALLQELNDVEVLVLASHSFTFRQQRGDSVAWRDVTRWVQPTLASPQAEQDRYALQKSYRDHLTRLGLLRPCFPMAPSVGRHRSVSDLDDADLPQFDYTTGMMKSSGLDITDFGELVLRKVGLVREDSAQADRS